MAFVRILGKDAIDNNSADYNVGLRQLAQIARNNNLNVDVYDPLIKTDSICLKKYKIVGFYAHHLNIELSLNLAKKLKIECDCPYIIFGGHHVSATAKELLDDHPYINAVCIGEGEDVIDTLSRALSKGEDLSRFNGAIKSKKIWNLDTVPMHIPPKVDTIARICTSRGCPFNCSFCTTPAMKRIVGPKRMRTASPEHVLKEFQNLSAMGIKHVRINDDNYVVNSDKSRKRAFEIAKLLIENKIRLKYKAEFRIDTYSADVIEELNLLKKSGLTEVFLGLETGSKSIEQELNKQMNIDKVYDYLRKYRDCGIVINPGNMLASPNSTPREIRISINNFRKLGLAYMFFRRLTFRVLVFPGTELERRLLAEGRLESKPRYLDRKYKFMNTRVEDVVHLFEEKMPAFMPMISGFFPQRKSALHRGFLNRNSSINNRINEILEDLNNSVANILIYWFHDAKSNYINKSNRDDAFSKLEQLYSSSERKLRFE